MHPLGEIWNKLNENIGHRVFNQRVLPHQFFVPVQVSSGKLP
jgi:hypothetical protein